MKNFLQTLRTQIEKEEVFYFLGLALVYLGAAAQFGHPVAQMLAGLVLLYTAFYLVRNT